MHPTIFRLPHGGFYVAPPHLNSILELDLVYRPILLVQEVLHIPPVKDKAEIKMKIDLNNCEISMLAPIVGPVFTYISCFA